MGVAIKTYGCKYGRSNRKRTDVNTGVARERTGNYGRWKEGCDIFWKRFSAYHYPKKFLWLVISTEPFQETYVHWNSTLP